MSIEHIAKGIASKVSSGRIKLGTLIVERPSHKKGLRGRGALPPGTKSAPCTKGNHKCYSLTCACECHQPNFTKPEIVRSGAARDAISRGMRLSWAKRKSKNKTKER